MARPSCAAFAIVALACALTLALSVGLDHPILNLNEGLYARVAQEMLDGGSWIVPTLDGVPYLEKPPLLYWITALGFALFGVSNWSARIPSVLGALLMLGAIAFIAVRHLGRRAAVYAVAILASSPLFVAMERTLMFDTLFTGLLAAALVAMHEAMVSERPAPWMRASAAFLGAAILAKGLAAPAFYLAIAGLAIALSSREERRRRLAAMADPWALAIFLAIAVPWHVMASMRQPRFAWFYFVNEHVMRFLGRRFPRDYHAGPPWYYLPRMIAYAFPWILLLLLPVARERIARAPLRGFLLAWVLVPLAIFSASSDKGDYYMIVGLPPLAVILAARLAALRAEQRFALVPAGWMAVLAGMGAWLLVRTPAPFHMPASAPLWLACGFAMCAASLGAVLLRRHAAAIAACAAMAVPLALVLSGFVSANAEAKSARDLAKAIERSGAASVYVYRDYEKFSALPFYLRHSVGVIGSRSKDLWFGLRLRPDARRFPAASGWQPALMRGGATMVVVATSYLAEFRRSPVARGLVPVGRFGEAWLFRSAPPAGRIADASAGAR
jgi:4-amino-4-deoxy-L-arabinose transferase-like glycosyltransferase